MAEMRWDRPTLLEQDPADIDDLVSLLTVRRLVAIPDRVAAYHHIEESSMAQIDLALNPRILEGFE